jgi:hypothetical protein
MKSTVQADMSAHGVKPVFVMEANHESFDVPIRFGHIRQGETGSPGLYRIRLREHHVARIKRTWAWERTLAQA